MLVARKAGRRTREAIDDRLLLLLLNCSIGVPLSVRGWKLWVVLLLLVRDVMLLEATASPLGKPVSSRPWRALQPMNVRLQLSFPILKTMPLFTMDTGRT